MRDRIGGRTVVITGAARGIGYATATALLDRGARVVIGDRDVAALAQALANLGPAAPVSGHPLDVSDPASFAEFLDRARADGGGAIDVLINNAGVMPVGAFLAQSERAIETAIDVNLRGVLNGCRLVLPEMVARGRGHIINIASLAGVVPVPGQVVYAGTKFAVVGLSCAMADEFAGAGVAVSVVMPPFTRTELIAGTKNSGASRPIEPAVIAKAIVKTLNRPKTHVAVPYPMRFVSPLLSLMGPRTRRTTNRVLGADRLFLDFDAAARASYQQRAESATGVLPGEKGPNQR
ncbi:SDR family oxidoreductase [Mycolicibacterium fallax]|uniref:Short-chain dehydrogenase n=1 Tax=Mycolicibacterium fallax TaxID=1793 RepID=A0A1X1R3N6_MYCFA|nr:SDR family oxidoreductase [Mycolicibacterium fallax]ORU98941.1 short-chain dehydrogenase [Mycolicibacterium fallax]BBZ00033.1 short-chain dehydrogenase [Mycolicibacterium fallax]HSA41748.1 SDR family oxidoreductase [Mycobacterium sp.]